MIKFNKLLITDIKDYDKLIVIIGEKYVDKEIISMLKEKIGTACAAIIIEYPYYEKDYLSTYYTFYSKQHCAHSKVCIRLHFLGAEINDSKEREYYGYVSLREGIKNSKLGKTYLSPKLLLPENEKAYLMLDAFSADVYGRKLCVNAFPWMRQETDVSVCAHVAMWSILRYYGNRYKGHRDTVMGEIVDSVQNEKGRKIPSHGLTPDQIVNTLDLYNFSPVLLGDEFHKLHYFINEIISYIESGIPVVATMNRKRHAITLFGHGKVDYDRLNNNDISLLCEKDTKIVMHSSLIQNVYAIDDNYFSYKVIDPYIPISDKEIDYALCEINYIIIPYCEKVLLGFNEIYEKFMEIVRNKVMEWEGLRICRIYLTSANSFKEKAADNMLMNEDLKKYIRLMDMPKFIWCIDLATVQESKDNLISGRLIADSTAGTQTENPWLLMHNTEKLSIIGEEGILYEGECTIDPYTAYENNLQNKDKITLCRTKVWEELYD